jgi:hypothetical protein
MKGTLASAVIARYGHPMNHAARKFAPASQRRVGYLCRSGSGTTGFHSMEE